MTSILKRFSDTFAGADSKMSPIKTKGAPGTAIHGGYILTDEKNADLAGTKKYQTYSDLLGNVSIVAAGTRYFLNLVSKAKWKVIPADETEDAARYAKIVEAQMTGMDTSWSRVIRRAAMYRFYGFSIQEWTMIKKDGIFQFIDIAPRPQVTIERWDTDPYGKVLGVAQRSPQTAEELYLPRKKIIYVVDDSINDSPEGLGLFRHVVSNGKRLERYEQLEGYGFESDLRGIPVGRAPFAEMEEAVDTGLITKADMANAVAPITSFVSNHIKNPALGILLDSITYQTQDEAGSPSDVYQWDIDLLKGSATSFSDIAVAIERVNREIARTLGVDGLLLGESSGGSHALSSDKSLNFALIVDSTLNELTDTYQRDMVARLFEVNGWPEELQPTFNTEAMQHRDITQITQALKDLAAAGGKLTMNDPAINDIREMLGLPDQPELTAEEFSALQSKGGASTNAGRGTDTSRDIADGRGNNDPDSSDNLSTDT
jgi:hypothetical protein